MNIGQFSVAAATAVVGYDLADGEMWQQQAFNRVITGFALAGSAAALDTKVTVFVDSVKVGEFYNTKTGMANNDDIMGMNAFVPAHARIHILVDDAPATSPINGIVRTRAI